MEDLPEMEGGSKMYHAEDELYPRSGQAERKDLKGLNFSDLERQLPWVFLGLYAIFFIGIVVLILWL